MSSLRIAVDAHRLVCEPLTSGATYLRTLVSEWIRRDDAPEVDLLVPGQPGPELAGQPLFADRKVRLIAPLRSVDPTASFRAQFFWQQRTIPALLRRNRPQVYFSPFHLTPQLPLGLRMATTIHDLCFLTEPRCSRGSLIHGMQVWSACLRAARLVCVSQFTFDTLARWSPQFARKAKVVHNGIAGRTMPLAEARDRVRRLCAELAPRQYLLWIGHPSHRKNPGLLFDIFGFCRQRWPDHKFVVVAPAATQGQLRALAQSSGVLPALRLFSGIDDLTRDALYRCAQALVFPSRCEGFGYPVLEAMFQGCPPLSVQNGPTREMVEGIVPLVAEPSPPAFMDALGWCATLSGAGRDRVEADLILRAGQFSSKAMADGTLDVLKQAALE